MNNTQEFLKLQIAKAKEVPMDEVLSKLGYRRVGKPTDKYVIYENPLRLEKNASFKVWKSENRCKDYGNDNGKGYDTIDIVRQVNKCSLFEAIGFILGIDTKFPTGKEKEQNPAPEGKGVEILKAIRLDKNKFLLEYLASRKINIRYAKACEKLFEVYYTVNGKYKDNGKPYFALGFGTQSGYELRTNSKNARYISTPHKDISLITHPFSHKIAVFEGFIDYLSALTHFGKVKSDHNVLILNSVSNREKALPILAQYEQVLGFLDRDKTGLECLDFFRNKGLQTLDYSKIYKGYKDFNEFLCR